MHWVLSYCLVSSFIYVTNLQLAAAAGSDISLLHRSGMLETGFQRDSCGGRCCDVSELAALASNWSSTGEVPDSSVTWLYIGWWWWCWRWLWPVDNWHNPGVLRLLQRSPMYPRVTDPLHASRAQQTMAVKVSLTTYYQSMHSSTRWSKKWGHFLTADILKRLNERAWFLLIKAVKLISLFLY